MIKSRYGKAIFLMLLFLVLGLLTRAFYQGGRGSGSADILLEEDGKQILRIADYRNVEEGIYPFQFQKGEGALEIREGKVRMLEMDRVVCPEGICSDTGYTDSVFQPIVCLPNRLILTVVEQGKMSPDIIGG